MKNNPYCTEEDSCDKTCPYCQNINNLPGINPQTFKIVLEKPYWQELKEKYEIPLGGELMDEEVFKWYEKDQGQSNYLIEKYGEHSWKVNELANALRNEHISESHFRELVRYQFEECFKQLKKEQKQKLLDKYNHLNSQLLGEKHIKLTKTLNVEKIKELEIKVKLLKETIIETTR